MNRIDELFKRKKGNILSIFFTAGYPDLQSTVSIIRALADSGVDMLEIGMPFSDPMADGPVIQMSSQAALKNGMSLKILFSQLADIRKDVTMPLILMGYLNPVLQYGMENFCSACELVGIDGIILPDLPPGVYQKEYHDMFKKHGLYNILLISPQSDDRRIRSIDNFSQGFIYMVSSSSVTGRKGKFSDEQLSYFRRIKSMVLNNPVLTGFGISDRASFLSACEFSNGGIIGSAFVSALGKGRDIAENVKMFVSEIKG